MLGAESAVVILDDTEGVWRNHRDNLIQASSNSMLSYKFIFNALSSLNGRLVAG